MHLSPGTRFGPYEIVSLLGSGGMGEVYKARDTRLKREVAVKVLTGSFSADDSRVGRFRVEAQAASALNHPNIMTVYDVGANGDAPYLVEEFLEGESLGDRLRAGKLSVARALDFARQIAAGLAAAHAKGIVHRDIKPENLFICRDGRVKILDFGLARITAPVPEQQDLTRTAITQEGTITGTVPYMSPEQVRGKPVDHRSDIFSFGCVFYEMLSGVQPFRKDTSTETMAAILKDDPAEIPATVGVLPPALERIVQHCLEKDPDARFQSAQDIVFALQTLSGTSQPAIPALQPETKIRKGAWPRWIGFAMFAAGLAVGALVAYQLSKPPQITFHRLTFRRGRIQGARFTPDGNGVVYSGQWENEPSELYTGRFDSPGSRALGSPATELFAISSSGELAIKQRPRLTATSFFSPGILARLPLSGGAPRGLESHITFADWSPDGKQLATVRETDQGQQLEYPIGTVLYRTTGAISAPRISPSGDRIAFLQHGLPSDDGGVIMVADLAGHARTLTPFYESTTGLAWSPNGKEVWFSAAKEGARCLLWAVTLAGRERLVYGGPTNLVLHDISRDGRVLASNQDDRSALWFRPRLDAPSRELSWLDWSVLSDISRDGKMVAFSESGEGAPGGAVSYLRDTNGAPAVFLGPGVYPTFAPDGQSVVAVDRSSIVIYPVGPGEPKRFSLPGFNVRAAGLLSDGTRIWFNGNEGSHPLRFYLTDIHGAKPRSISPDGVQSARAPLLLGDKYLAGRSQSGLKLYPVDGGDSLAVPSVPEEFVTVAGSAGDGYTLFLATQAIPSKIYRCDVRTGKADRITEAAPPDYAGILGGMLLKMTPDGNSYAYSYPQELSELQWIEGLR